MGADTSTTGAPEHLAVVFRMQAAGCRNLGSPFYGDLCDLLAEDAEREGAVVVAMGAAATAPFDDMQHLRLIAGLHRLALSGESGTLAAHFPSTGGDGDAYAMWPAVESVLRACPPALREALARPVQTNEVGRAAPLASAFAVVAARTGLPLRLLEIGSSAGLNLRLDRFWFEAGGVGWGDRGSAVRFVDVWEGGAPPFGAATPVAARRGCDRAPIDVAVPGADLTLLSFVWPDQAERFARLRAALAIARDAPVTVDATDVAEWLPAQLAEPAPGVATVVFHSIVWQYLPPGTRRQVIGALRTAGARATAAAPLAWVRLEPAPQFAHAELRCTTWPGGEEQLLAVTGFHAGPIAWRV
jgi:hypothetical protein